jgi:hypothetical protein
MLAQHSVAKGFIAGMIKQAMGESTAGMRRAITTDGRVGARYSGFRVVLPSWTRPLKHPVLELVNDKPMRLALRKEPREHRQNLLFQMMGS